MKSLIDDSLITCYEIVDTPETVPIYLNDKKARYKEDYYIFHTFLLATILLLIIVTICYHCLKNWVKQIPYNITIVIMKKLQEK